jgi:hypothetical protein
MNPEPRFAWNGDSTVAYEVVGDGPVHLVCMPGFYGSDVSGTAVAIGARVGALAQPLGGARLANRAEPPSSAADWPSRTVANTSSMAYPTGGTSIGW